MFENISEKIKNLAETLCWIGFITAFILAGICIIIGIGEEETTLIVTGIVGGIIFAMISWISYFTLYGFGELIEKTTIIADVVSTKITQENSTNHKIEQEDTSKYIIPNGTKYCHYCGHIQKKNNSVCVQCGERI